MIIYLPANVYRTHDSMASPNPGEAADKLKPPFTPNEFLKIRATLAPGQWVVIEDRGSKVLVMRSGDEYPDMVSEVERFGPLLAVDDPTTLTHACIVGVRDVVGIPVELIDTIMEKRDEEDKELADELRANLPEPLEPVLFEKEHDFTKIKRMAIRVACSTDQLKAGDLGTIFKDVDMPDGFNLAYVITDDGFSIFAADDFMNMVGGDLEVPDGVEISTSLRQREQKKTPPLSEYDGQEPAEGEEFHATGEEGPEPATQEKPLSEFFTEDVPREPNPVDATDPLVAYDDGLKPLSELKHQHTSDEPELRREPEPDPGPPKDEPELPEPVEVVHEDEPPPEEEAPLPEPVEVVHEDEPPPVEEAPLPEPVVVEHEEEPPPVPEPVVMELPTPVEHAHPEPAPPPMEEPELPPATTIDDSLFEPDEPSLPIEEPEEPTAPIEEPDEPIAPIVEPEVPSAPPMAAPQPPAGGMFGVIQGMMEAAGYLPRHNHVVSDMDLIFQGGRSGVEVFLKVIERVEDRDVFAMQRAIRSNQRVTVGILISNTFTMDAKLSTIGTYVILLEPDKINRLVALIEDRTG